MPDKKIMISLASGLEDLGGTEVLSEEEHGPFASTPTSAPNNKHFFDFELPLDSDKDEKEENDPNSRSNSLDDLPLVIKIESSQESLQISGGLRSSPDHMRASNDHAPVLEVVAEDPLIEQTTQIVIDESFKEEEPALAARPQLAYYVREEIESALLGKYGLTLKPAPLLPQLRDEVERILLSKYGVSWPSRAHSPAGEEIEALLANKYGLTLKKNK